MLDKLGRLSLRVANAGLVVLVCFIAERLLSADLFGEMYIIVGLSSVSVSLIDFYNQKYLIDIYSRCGNKFISEVFSIKVMTGLLIPIIVLVMYVFFNIEMELSLASALYIYLSIICQSFSIAFFCSKTHAHHLLKSNTIGFVGFSLFLSVYISYIDKDLLAFVGALISYKIFEFGYYLHFFGSKSNNVFLFCSLFKIKEFIKNNFRCVFYLQWVLSLLSAKAGTLILPHVVSYHEIAVFAKFTIISSFVYFWLSFSASTFYSEICNSNLSKGIIKKKLIEIILTSLMISIILLIVTKYYYEELWEHVSYILPVMILTSLTCYQGYILFYYKLDSAILYLSVCTLLLSCLCYFILPGSFGVKGIFISNLCVEAFSFVASVFIVCFSHNKKKAQSNCEYAS